MPCQALIRFVRYCNWYSVSLTLCTEDFKSGCWHFEKCVCLQELTGRWADDVGISFAPSSSCWKKKHSEAERLVCVSHHWSLILILLTRRPLSDDLANCLIAGHFSVIASSLNQYGRLVGLDWLYHQSLHHPAHTMPDRRPYKRPAKWPGDSF